MVEAIVPKELSDKIYKLYSSLGESSVKMMFCSGHGFKDACNNDIFCSAKLEGVFETISLLGIEKESFLDMAECNNQYLQGGFNYLQNNGYEYILDDQFDKVIRLCFQKIPFVGKGAKDAASFIRDKLCDMYESLGFFDCQIQALGNAVNNKFEKDKLESDKDFLDFSIEVVEDFLSSLIPNYIINEDGVMDNAYSKGWVCYAKSAGIPLDDNRVICSKKMGR